MKKCPFCDEEIQEKAKKCKHCGEFVETAAAAPGGFPGEKFGEYRIIRELGRGGMAAVYLAEDPSLPRKVGIKILPRHLLNEPELTKRFKKEAQVAAGLTHPNIVSIFTVGEGPEGLPFYTMALLEGGALSDRIRLGPLPFEEALRIANEVLSGLGYAHAKGIIHRDIKPANILFTETGTALIADFGIAKAKIGTHIGTAMGSIIGTPHYMSPEQWGGKEVDARSDIYSVGAVLFQMLTGNPPFLGDDANSVMCGHILNPIPVPGQVVAGIPPWVDAMLLKALAKDPAARFQTAEEFRQELEEHISEWHRTPLPKAPAGGSGVSGISGVPGVSGGSSGSGMPGPTRPSGLSSPTGVPPAGDPSNPEFSSRILAPTPAPTPGPGPNTGPKPATLPDQWSTQSVSPGTPGVSPAQAYTMPISPPPGPAAPQGSATTGSGKPAPGAPPTVADGAHPLPPSGSPPDKALASQNGTNLVGWVSENLMLLFLFGLALVSIYGVHSLVFSNRKPVTPASPAGLTTLPADSPTVVPTGTPTPDSSVASLTSLPGVSPVPATAPTNATVASATLPTQTVSPLPSASPSPSPSPALLPASAPISPLASGPAVLPASGVETLAASSGSVVSPPPTPEPSPDDSPPNVHNWIPKIEAPAPTDSPEESVATDTDQSGSEEEETEGE